jgi:hypothetical protein
MDDDELTRELDELLADDVPYLNTIKVELPSVPTFINSTMFDNKQSDSTHSRFTDSIPTRQRA